MINIFLKNKQLIITEKEDSSKLSLVNPLHKLFFRNYLNGLPDPNDKEKWLIPYESITSLKILLNHLLKYKLDLSLDDQCSKILELDQKERNEFQSKVILAEKAKIDAKKGDINNLKQELLPEFKRELNDKQFRALYHLIKIENGANFSVPGSGKTTVALAYYHILKKRGIVNNLFIIGPASVFEPWEHEYYECMQVKPNSIRIAGNPKNIRKQIFISYQKYEIYLSTYHSVARDLKEVNLLLQNRNTLLILDESHYVKKPQGGLLAESILKIAKHAKRRVILTGTPMPNGLADLWSQITFLWHNQMPLGSSNKYLKDIDKVDLNKLDIVKEKINPFFFRVTKSELKLPNQSFNIINCELKPLQKRIYRGVAERFLTQLDLDLQDKETYRELRRARTIRLLQIASNPTLLKRNCEEFLIPPLKVGEYSVREIIDNYPKLEIPSKILKTEELATRIINQGKKVIIWTSFVHNLFMLEKILKTFNPVVLYGGIPYQSSDNIDLTREKIISDFKNDKSCKILLANPAACAESISLHKVCTSAIYLDRSFNCAHYIQSQDRIHRLGLKPNEEVEYYLLMSTETIDQVIHKRLNDKMANMSHIIEGKLPENIPGYWNNDLGAQEDEDFDLVDAHIRKLFKK